jgi:DNA polymerase-3 subunit alpha
MKDNDEKSFLPKKYVNIHSHDGFSFYDGMGLPKQHFDFVIKNSKEELEVPALAITNHGNMNSFCHAWLAAKELNKAGQPFKFLPGCELYVHPDLAQWARDRATSDDTEDEQHGSTVENENETKSNKFFNPIKRRHHLVVLAKDSKGLEKLFGTVSRGYIEGFYKFPRVDYAMLKKHKGSFIGSSACLGGPLSFAIYSQFQGMAFDEASAVQPGMFLGPHLVDDPTTMQRVLSAVENEADKLVDAFGEENFFIELQFNKLSAQHLTNRVLIELAKKTGLKLVATADSHYYHPDVWREREIYKQLGWLNYTDYSPDSLPKTVDDLKCELYPKNAAQMWQGYKKTGLEAGHTFYDDAVIRDAIEMSYHIAFDIIGDVQPDTSTKLPSWSVPKGKTADGTLQELCFEGMVRMGLAGKEEYEKRLAEELSVISDKKFSEYFLMTKQILDIAAKNMLLGPARGSAGGSLVNYVLGITQIDPLRYNLLFERFLNRNRAEMPDIDNDIADRDLLIKLLKEKFGDTNVLPVSNYNTFALKSLIKDVSRFFHHEGEDDGLDFQTVNEVLGPLDDEVRRKVLKQGDDKNLFELKLDDCLQYSPKFKEFMEAHPDVFRPIKILLHENKALGKHAGGVIICDDLMDKMPIITSKRAPQTPWVEGMHYKHLQDVSYCKIDLLGLETLRVIQRCIELIIKRTAGKKIELKFDGGQHAVVFSNQKLLLSDGSWKTVDALDNDDDIAFPLQLCW